MDSKKFEISMRMRGGGTSIKAGISHYGLPKIISSKEKEKAFRQECKENVQDIIKAFTFEEHMAIAFTPHVIIDTI